MMRTWLPTWMMILMVCGALWCLSAPVSAQLTDIHANSQSPQCRYSKVAGAAGWCRPQWGDINTPDTSRFIIARDPFRAIRRGASYSSAKFTVAQGLDRASVMG